MRSCKRTSQVRIFCRMFHPDEEQDRNDSFSFRIWIFGAGKQSRLMEAFSGEPNKSIIFDHMKSKTASSRYGVVISPLNLVHSRYCCSPIEHVGQVHALRLFLLNRSGQTCQAFAKCKVNDRIWLVTNKHFEVDQCKRITPTLWT